MDDFKGKISKEVLDSLTMEDLWKSPGLKNYVEKNYPRAYLAITEPWREFGLYSFIKIAEEQKQFVKKEVNVICHLCQKLITLNAKKGLLKF